MNLFIRDVCTVDNNKSSALNYMNPNYSQTLLMGKPNEKV